MIENPEPTHSDIHSLRSSCIVSISETLSFLSEYINISMQILLFYQKEMITTVNGVEVTIYKPATPTSGLRPGIIHYHGGGWVLFEPGFSFNQN